MQKIIAILFLILTVAGTFYPCCMEDDCAGETVQTGTHDPGEHKDKGPCSPFFACGTCAASVDITTISYTIYPLALLTMHHPSYIVFAGSDYSSSLFQPPRMLTS